MSKDKLKIMITGGDGQLGRALVKILNSGEWKEKPLPVIYQNAQIFASDIDTLDFTDYKKVEAYVLSNKPDIIIHAGAMTNVDGCEEVKELAMKVNGEATGNLAKLANNIGAKMVMISTDYVFDGQKQSAYVEDDMPNPQSVYGKSKLFGESLILQNCDTAFVVRTSWVYGEGKNFVKTIISKGRELGKLKVVGDQWGCPTNADDLAYHILLLASGDSYGIYHCVGQGQCSWYQFAKTIVQIAGIKCEVSECKSEDYPQKAIRPKHSALSNKKLFAQTKSMPRDWQVGIMDYIKGASK